MDHLSRIGVFTEVVRHESFIQAARTIGITSSAVSKQIQRLEDDLGVKLLNRTTRKVSLTEEGAVFFERATRALEDLREATEQVHELKATPRGPLKISVPASFGARHLTGAIADFARTYPDVRIEAHFDDRIVDMATEQYDLSIRIAALKDSSLISRKLAPCPFLVCASPDYLARCGTPTRAEDLAAHNVLAYTHNKGAHEWRYKDADGREGVTPLTSTFKCDAADMMVEAARQGIGVIISPIFFVHADILSGRLVPVLQSYTTWPERAVYAVFPPSRYLSTRLRLFVDAMARHCGGLCQGKTAL